MMVPQKHIPGEPGMQQKWLTSEHATFFDRLYDETYILRSAPSFPSLIFCVGPERCAATLASRPDLEQESKSLGLISFRLCLGPLGLLCVSIPPRCGLSDSSLDSLIVSTDQFDAGSNRSSWSYNTSSTRSAALFFLRAATFEVRFIRSTFLPKRPSRSFISCPIFVLTSSAVKLSLSRLRATPASRRRILLRYGYPVVETLLAWLFCYLDWASRSSLC